MAWLYATALLLPAAAYALWPLARHWPAEVSPPSGSEPAGPGLQRELDELEEEAVAGSRGSRAGPHRGPGR